MIRIAIVSRGLHWMLLSAVGMYLASYFFGADTIELQMIQNPTRPANYLRYMELLGIIGATIAATLSRPRLWHIERLGRGRERIVAAGAAVCAMALPYAAVVAGVAVAHDSLPPAPIATNALVMITTVGVIAPLLTPLAAGAIAVMLWFTFGVVNAAMPSFGDAALPVVAFPGPPGRWWVAAALVTSAVAVHALTRGRTAWATRRFDSEE